MLFVCPPLYLVEYIFVSHVFPDCVSFKLPRMLCNLLGHFGCVEIKEVGFCIYEDRNDCVFKRVLIPEKL